MKKKKRGLTIRESLHDAEHRFLLSGIEKSEAGDLLSWVLKKSNGFLLTNQDARITPGQQKIFSRIIKKRISGFPFAYIIGKKGFYGLDFFVSPQVLIPRPETESLIDWVIKQFPKDFNGTIADIGTGSGCIAITLAKYFPKTKIYARDVSESALAIARRNARMHRVASRIRFQKSSLLSQVTKPESIDLVVANLPYLSKEELGNVPFEPVKALYGGKLGLEPIEKCIAQVEQYKIKQAIFEISPTQEYWLSYILQKQKEYQFGFLHDLTGRVRFLTLKKAPGLQIQGAKSGAA